MLYSTSSRPSEAVFLLPLSIKDQTKFCIQRPFLSALLFILGRSEEYVFFCNHLTSMKKVHFQVKTPFAKTAIIHMITMTTARYKVSN